MSEVRGITGVVSPDRATKDDARLGLRMLRDGTPLSAEWLAGLQMEGRGFIANAGTVTSPITFGAGSIDSTEPDLGLTIAANTRWIIPYSIQVVFETFGTTLLLEGMAAAGTGLVLGTDTDVTPVSVRTHSQYTSQASVGVASNADATYFTANSFEFWRFGHNKIVDIATADDDSTAPQTVFTWSALESGI